MRKKILLAGLVLMAMGLQLRADISSPGGFSLGDSSVIAQLQVVDSLITDTDRFSFLDISPQSPLPGGINDFSRLTPAFNMNKPVAPVPEPTHYALMGLGIIGLFLARRDRRNAAK